MNNEYSPRSLASIASYYGTDITADQKKWIGKEFDLFSAAEQQQFRDLLQATRFQRNEWELYNTAYLMNSSYNRRLKRSGKAAAQEYIADDVEPMQTAHHDYVNAIFG